jgi:hypothetical protein
MKRLLIIFTTLLLLSGCATARHAVPPELFGQVRICGMQDIRFAGDHPSAVIQEDIIRSIAQEQERDFPLDQEGFKVYPQLAISGGAANGAYGAGLLKGWSAAGTRPVFKIVTGISTGAIIAPLAFLGSRYDDRLEEIYTTYSTKDIARARRFLSILFHDSFASTRPLQFLIRKYFDKELLEAIAGEYRKGRRLYVGTTDLDRQQFVLWDMGRIASYGGAEALELFRKIILASASIPAAFSPVFFEAEADGKTYNEMHVDGGTTRQVSFLFDVLIGTQKTAEQKGLKPLKFKHRIYVIRNGYIDSLWKQVPDRLGSIAERSMDTMINAQGLGDIYQLYTFTTMSQGDFNLAVIPSTHISQAKEIFDPAEMRKLFDLGFTQAANGYPWRKAPPGVEEIERMRQ